MKELRLLHFADMHLGFRDDFILTFDKIFEIATDQKPDIVICAGDLFDRKSIPLDVLNHVADTFNNYCGPIVLIPGNHDPFHENCIYSRMQLKDNTHILANDNSGIVLKDPDTVIYGVGFDDYLDPESEETWPLFDERNAYNILVAHCTPAGQKGAYNGVPLSKLAGTNADYIALGHIHKPMLNIGGYGNIFNPGSPEPLGYDEPGIHGMISAVLQSDMFGNVTVTTEYIKTAAYVYTENELRFSDPFNISVIKKETSEIIENATGISDMSGIKGRFRVHLKNDEAACEKIVTDTLGKILSECEIRFIYKDDNHEIKKEENTFDSKITIAFKNKIDEMLDKAVTAEERAIIERAYIIGMEAMKDEN